MMLLVKILLEVGYFSVLFSEGHSGCACGTLCFRNDFPCFQTSCGGKGNCAKSC